MDPAIATKLTFILAQIGKMHELSITEKRINALENALSGSTNSDLRLLTSAVAAGDRDESLG
jgi:hypothetical protein